MNIKKILVGFAAAAMILSTVYFITPVSTASAKPTTSTVIYNNIPDPTPGNLPSQAFEATSTSEFGGQIALAGTERQDPTVTVLMSSWGCENGHWYNGDCVTTPGATFSVPITLNIYEVGAGNEPGTKIKTVTETFNIPYRPSANDVNCKDGNDGKWFDGETCYNGLATPIKFNLTGFTLPNNVIVSVAFNTTHYGYNPIGSSTCSASSGGCGYDSLNVAVTAPPTVGTDPLPNAAYLNSTWSGAYGDNGAGGLGTFRLDPTGWTGYQPAIKVEISTPAKVDICHKAGKSGKYNLINVSKNAEPAHLAHGDGLPGSPVPNSDVNFTDTCKVPTLVDTVTVPANQFTNTLSNISLANGTQYYIKASGTWTNSLNVADAEFASNDAWVTHFDGYNIPPWSLGVNEFDLQINDTFVDWGAYSSAHDYSYAYTGTGSPVGFRIFDGDSTVPSPVVNPGWYGDNSGSLTVKIYSLQ